MEKLPILEKEQGEKFGSQIEVLKDEEGKTIDLLVIEGVKKISFKEFIPPDVKLESGSGFMYDPLNKTIYFDFKKINSLMGKLGLLHETGHAIDYNEHEDANKKFDFRGIWQQITDAKVELFISEPKEILKNKDKHQSYLLENLPKKIKELNIPQEKLSEFIKSLVRNERIAWAGALKLYRKIKKENDIDILDGIKNKEIIKAIEDPLGSYDKIFRVLLPEQQVKLFLVKKFGGETEAK